jgi:CubicO group peptidase (beta-lactamase class C family)
MTKTIRRAIKNMVEKTLYAVLIMFVSTATIDARAQNNLPRSTIEAIDTIMKTVLENGGSPGASVAVVVNGKYRWSNAYGVTDLESGSPTRPDTVFRIASISKMLTATAAMQLVESGKIEPNVSAHEYCAAFPATNSAITVHHLLSHQSGLRHWRTTAERFNQTRYKKIEATLKVVEDSPLLFEPGTADEYSTPGYNVVGCVIEGASGTDYADFMQKHIFKPAGMSSAFIGDPPSKFKNKASGYRPGPGGPRPARKDDLSIKFPGGGLSGSVVDLARFAEALFQGKLLQPETIETMWTPKLLADGTKTNKGYGCNIGEEKGRQVVWHIGGVSGFCGNLYIYPDRKAAVVVLFNLEAQDVFPTASTIMDELLK